MITDKKENKPNLKSIFMHVKIIDKMVIINIKKIKTTKTIKLFHITRLLKR